MPYAWKKEDPNPDNMIRRRCQVLPQRGQIFIPERHAPEGAPIVEVQFQDGAKKKGVLLGGPEKPIRLTIMSVLDADSIGAVRFREEKKPDGEVAVRPYMYLPVMFPGCPDLYRLTICGMSADAFTEYVIEFHKQVIKPALATNPDVFQDLFGFELVLQFSRRVTAQRSFFLAPELSFQSYENYLLPPDEIEINRGIFETKAWPFINKQEELRVKEKAKKFDLDIETIETQAEATQDFAEAAA